jgi:hypothetical protein
MGIKLTRPTTRTSQTLTKIFLLGKISKKQRMSTFSATPIHCIDTNLIKLGSLSHGSRGCRYLSVFLNKQKNVVQFSFLDSPLYAPFGFQNTTMRETTPDKNLRVNIEETHPFAMYINDILNRQFESRSRELFGRAYSVEKLQCYGKIHPLVSRDAKHHPLTKMKIEPNKTKFFWGMKNGEEIKTVECCFDDVKDLVGFYCIPFIKFKSYCFVGGTFYPMIRCIRLIVIWEDRFMARDETQIH